MSRTVVLGLGAVIAGGALATYLNRAELNRYRRILQMENDPSVVGVSVTPQGNTLALHQSEQQRRRNRDAGSIDPQT